VLLLVDDSKRCNDWIMPLGRVPLFPLELSGLHA
jgi:hypothetical protein